MGYASRFGKARVNSKSPQAFSICDRCGFGFNHCDLRWQFAYAGAGLINKRILVCTPCYDTPQNQLRAIVLPPDPVPILNPRAPDFYVAATDARLTDYFNPADPVTGIPVPEGDIRITQTVDTRVTQQTGEPPFGKNQRPGTDPNAPGDINPGVPPGNIDVPETGPLE